MTPAQWAQAQASAWWLGLSVRQRWGLALSYPAAREPLEIMRALNVEIPKIPHGWFKPCTCERCTP